MNKIFSTQFHKGSLIDEVSGVVCTTTGKFLKMELGYSLKLEPTQTLSFSTSIVGAKNIVIWSKGGVLTLTMAGYNIAIGGVSLDQYKTTLNTLTGTFVITNNTSYSIYITNIMFFDVILSTTETNDLYAEFLQSFVTGHFAIQKTNFQLPIVTELNEEGLVAAYIPSIKTVVGGQLLDISGNGKHLTNTNTHLTVEGLKYKTNSKSTGANWGNVKSIAFRIKLDSTTEKILEGAANDKLIYVNAGTVTYPDFDNCFINGIDSDTITANVWHTVVITSITDVSMSAVTVGLNNTTYGNFEIDSLKPYNYELSVAEIKAYHNSFIKPILIEDFRNYPVGRISNKGTGVYDVVEETIGNAIVPFRTKLLKCITAGTYVEHYTRSTSVDASIDYYDGTTWYHYSDTLANLISTHAWLSLTGGYLTFTLTANQQVANINIANGVK